MDGLVCKDLEEQLLSSIIYDNEIFFEAETYDGLFTSIRIDIYLAIKQLIERGDTANIISIHEHLGGKIKASDIAFISDAPILTYDAKLASDKLKLYALKRSAAKTYENAVERLKGYDDPLDVISSVNSAILVHEDEQIESVKDISVARFKDFEEQIKNGASPGLMTGHKTIDDKIGGFHRGEWVVIAARPGMGKTSLAMNWARHWGHMSYTGLVFSLEMSKYQLVDRMACDVGDVDSSYIFQGKFDSTDLSGPIWGNYKTALRTIRQMHLYIDDTARMDISKMMVRAKSVKARHGLDFVIVDYLQLIAGWNNEGQGPKANITGSLKIMARELDVPVITLCQMNREIEKRNTKAPKNSDLRDAGSIEQDADHIMFPLLPHKFDESNETDTHSAFIFLTKNRRGETGRLPEMRWDGEYFRYSDKVMKGFE